MTRGEQVRQIMADERERTMRRIENLQFSPRAVEDVYALWARVQGAINAYVGEQDRVIDHRVVPALLRLAADEGDCVFARLHAEGLAMRVQQS